MHLANVRTAGARVPGWGRMRSPACALRRAWTVRRHQHDLVWASFGGPRRLLPVTPINEPFVAASSTHLTIIPLC